MRTQKEIVEKARAKSKDFDLFGIVGDYVTYLDWEHAKEFLTEDANEKEFNEDRREYTKENVIAEIKDYLDFAYSKAEGARGISSNRSIEHFQVWLWLIKDDELHAFALDDDNYPMYGFPILQKIAEKYAPEMVKDYNNIEDETGAPVMNE